MNKKRTCFDTAGRVVIKVGSGVLTHNNGLNLKAILSITRQINELINNGLEVILVSSGAMASGVKKLGLSSRPESIPERQAVAAIGQAGLIMEYEKAFEKYNKKVAQILLTRGGLINRKRYLNARNTLNKLLSWNVVPIINENDTVAVEEIKIGDNDNLSAMITTLMDADILINLTDIEGVFTKDPRTYPDAELIPVIESITKDIERLAGDIPGPLNAGGMLSKIKAANKVISAGIPMVIAKGETKDILLRLFAGEEHGTFFVPKRKRLSSRKCWIAFTLKSKGVITIDIGAKAALLKGGKSLLPSGILEVSGNFKKGDPVNFKGPDEEITGTGLVNYSASDINKIMGYHSDRIAERLGQKPYDEVIHRDNMALTGASDNRKKGGK